MKKLVRFLMVCFLLLAVSEKLLAEDIVYKTLDFAKVKMQNCYTYSEKRTATYGKDSWRVYYFYYNKAGGPYVKCGRKNEISNAYIINMQPYEEAVSKIDIYVDKIKPYVVKYAQILISTDSNFTPNPQKSTLKLNLRKAILYHVQFHILKKLLL